MNDVLFNKLRERYFHVIEQNEREKDGLKAVEKRRDIVKQNPIVKQYLELEEQVKLLKENILSDDQMISEFFSYYEKLASEYKNNDDNDNNNIYFYLGSFAKNQYDEGYQINITNESRKKPEYNFYVNLETQEFIDVDYEEKDEFEKNNKVIITSSFPNILIYDKLRTEFFMDAMENGQDKARQRILTKYNNK